MIILGEDYGTTFNYAGLAPVAERLGRTVYLLNPRGVIGSQPDLSCPEADAVGPDRSAWLAAVQQCHDRLEAAGVDLAAYGSDSMPGDVLTLVDVLGLDSWNLGNWGTSSVVTLRLLAQDPAGLRSVVLDSPALPGDDPRTTLAGDTRRALDALFDACLVDGSCRHQSHTGADLDAAVDSLDRTPLERTLTVDGSMLVRLVRHALSDNGVTTPDLSASGVPEIIAGASRWTASMDRNLLTPLTLSAPYCEGYLPSCKAFHRTTLGVLLTDLCRNHGPATLPAGHDAIGRFAADSPYVAACDSLPVDRKDDAALPEAHLRRAGAGVRRRARPLHRRRPRQGCARDDAEGARHRRARLRPQRDLGRPGVPRDDPACVRRRPDRAAGRRLPRRQAVRF